MAPSAHRTWTGSAACVLLAAAAAAGCTRGSPAESGPSAAPGATASTSVSPLVADCVERIAYWARKSLNGERWSGLDWEQKGLTEAQHLVHERIVAAARVERERHGAFAAAKLIDRQAAAECAAQGGATHDPQVDVPPRPLRTVIYVQQPRSSLSGHPGPSESPPESPAAPPQDPLVTAP